MKNAFIGLVAGVILSVVIMFAFKGDKPVSLTDTALYQSQLDSLDRYRLVGDTLQDYRHSLAEKDRILSSKRKKEKTKDSERVDSVKMLPQSQQVAFFALKTQTDSIATLSDSTALVRPKTLQKTNILIVQGENAIKDNARLEAINQVKDERIKTDSLAIDNKASQIGVLSNQNAELVSDGKAKDATIKKEKTKKTLIIIGSVAVEILTIVLLL